LALHLTAEDQGDCQPLHDGAAQLTFTGDVRLDNRPELCAALGIPPQQGRTLADSALILRAYQAWGDDCPTRLLGDFAFAIWDGRRRRLLAVRDHIGAKSIFYVQTAALFAFASEPKALLALGALHPQIKPAINPAWIATYLTLVSCIEAGETVWQGILQLAPAQRLVVTEGKLLLDQYWALDPERMIRLSSDAEYAEALRYLFEEAVRCRLRGVHGVGSMLSGGLDSSSVACTAGALIAHEAALAEKKPLRLFSARLNGPGENDEIALAEAVAAQAQGELNVIEGHSVNPGENLMALMSSLDAPPLRPFLLVEDALYSRAAAQGIRVMLDGIDGDATLADCRSAYLRQLWRTLHWRRYHQEVRGLTANFGGSPWNYMAMAAPLPVRAMADRLRGRATEYQPPAIMAPALAKAYDLPGRVRRGQSQGWEYAATARQAHLARLGLYGMLDHWERTAFRHNIEARHPFADKRVVEFCLALPAEQKLHNGWPRVVLRRALVGLLPEVVAKRPGKGRGGHFYIWYHLDAFDPSER
jgi:asparagine synthase (glutamine-hydrolysing)